MTGSATGRSTLSYAFFLLLLFSLLLTPFNGTCIADDQGGSHILKVSLEGGGSGSSDTPLPDLFTGGMTYQIPLQVPPGRNGMEPGLTVVYNSRNGNGLLGVGWELEVGAIERSTRYGVDYSKDNYVLRRAGTQSELVQDPNDSRFKSKIESEFLAIQKLSNDSFLGINKQGIKFYFGGTNDSKIVGPFGTFRWALSSIVDTFNNTIDFTYTTYTDYDNQGNTLGEHQIYLDKIHYNDKTISFVYGQRGDVEVSYRANFKISTARRLANIAMFYGLDSAKQTLLPYTNYVFNYVTDPQNTDTQYSAATKRSLLHSIEQVSNDWNQRQTLGSFTYTSSTGGWDTNTWMYGPGSALCRVGDFNGDGKHDLACFRGYASDVSFSAGTGWQNSSWAGPDPTQCLLGDFDGDGKTDMSCYSGNGNWNMEHSSGTAWSSNSFGSGPSPGTPISAQCIPGDFDGDGKTDIACYTGTNGNWHVALSTGNGWNAKYWGGGPGPGIPIGEQCISGDFNGDGKADIACYTGANGNWHVALSTGNGWNATFWGGGPGPVGPIGGQCVSGDFNGDGKTDIACYTGANGNWHVALSTGNGWNATFWGGGPATSLSNCKTGDFNGDGKTDLACYSNNGSWYMALSTGSGWNGSLWNNGPGGDPSHCFAGDFNGDGKTDIACLVRWDGWTVGGGEWSVGISKAFPTDYVQTITNSSGGTTQFGFTPSTQNPNSILPFPLQTLTSISVNDGNGNTAITDLSYSFGHYQVGEHDFRGFNKVTVKGPAGPSGERKVTQTWFHQGNDTSVIPEAASQADITAKADVTTGYMKGKPYRTRTSTTVGSGNTLTTYSEEEITYTDQVTSPYYFSPVQQRDAYSCAGGATASCKDNAAGRHSQTVYAAYDQYGNVRREEQHGDLADLKYDRTIVRTYMYDEPQWLVALLATEEIYQGIGTSTAPVSSTTYDYYGEADSECKTYKAVSTTKGRVAKVTRTYKEGSADPEIWTGYDSFGNQACSRDAKGYVSKIGYDSSNTFPITRTLPPVSPNTVGLQTTTHYYGVDQDAADNGLYGQVKSESALHGDETTYPVKTNIYDKFGRKKKTTRPDGSWTSWDYKNFGTVNFRNYSSSQHVRTGNSEGSWSEDYFDGLGRSVKKRTSGPDGKIVVSDISYDGRGQVRQQSLPYFEGTETPRNTTYTYDDLGRVIQVTSPDPNTRTLSCYAEGVTVTVDAGNHRKRQSNDVFGRLTKVEEYLGTYQLCSPDAMTPYATTRYYYDFLGNMTDVYDNRNNHTSISYDSLGRKHEMTDPDMGHWIYDYDANGNMTSQKDGNQNTIVFQYDELNRLTLKDYLTGTDVTFRYDENTSSNPLGRLTTMTDDSGSTKYDYDVLGRVSSTTKTVDGTNYTVGATYDGLDRLQTVTYPGSDNEVVTTVYDLGGNISTVTGRIYDENKQLLQTTVYGTYTGYNAVGQPGNVTFGNHVTTTYSYNSANTNHWLSSITTTLPVQAQTKVVDLAFDYYNNGSIKATTDTVNTVIPQVSSQSYSLYPGKAHAFGVTGTDFKYDDNGNLYSDGQRTITYNYDNMPQGVSNANSAVTFTYDGNGARVKKNTDGGAKVYIGKYYEYVPGAIIDKYAKYIFAGAHLIAHKKASETYYYHADHLGSTAAVTDKNGAKAETVTYSAFGDTSDAPEPPNPGVSHQFTGQEHDAETSLYNYGARLYDPDMGRFISPDTIVQDYTDPQTLNRYSYARNNPLLYTDPTGHIFGIDDILIGMAVGSIIGAGVGGTTAAITGGNVLQGMAMGAITGAFSGGVAGGVSGTAVSGLTQAGLFGMAGAAGGATNAAVFGGNIGTAALVGGVGGFVGASMPGVGLFGNGPIGSTLNHLSTSALYGAGFGAAYAAFSGGDIGQASVAGAIGGLAGGAANMAIGHTIGLLGSGSLPKFQDGAFIYESSKNNMGAITFGNVIYGEKGFATYGVSANVQDRNLYNHELAHVNQYSRLGAAYLPTYGYQMPGALIVGENPVQFNVLENFLLGGARTTYDIYYGR